MRHLAFLALLGFLCVSCFSEISHDHGREATPVRKVSIVGTSLSKKKLSLYKISLKDVDLFPKVIGLGGLDSIVLDIDAPTFLYIGSINFTPLYVEPGDRILVENDSLNGFLFKNMDNPERNEELNFFFRTDFFPMQMTPAKIKTHLDRLDSLEKSGHLSTGFYDKARNYIISEEMNQAYSKKLYFNSNQNVKPFVESDSCVNFLSYRIAAYNYVLLYLKEKSILKPDFGLLAEAADHLFTGETKKVALFQLLNSKMNTDLNQPGYIQAIKKFSDSYPGDDLTRFLNNVYSKKVEILKSITSDIYNERLIDKGNNLITFSGILNKFPDKIVILDFWAQYCVPCLNEIPFSKKMADDLQNEDVVFIYISLDINYESWLENIARLGIGFEDRSYLMYLPVKSGIMEHFDIKSIPRYIVFGRDRKLISMDAPRPSDKALYDLIKGNLK